MNGYDLNMENLYMDLWYIENNIKFTHGLLKFITVEWYNNININNNNNNNNVNMTCIYPTIPSVTFLTKYDTIPRMFDESQNNKPQNDNNDNINNNEQQPQNNEPQQQQQNDEQYDIQSLVLVIQIKLILIIMVMVVNY